MLLWETLIGFLILAIAAPATMSPAPVIVERQTPSTRVLRGDWEPPDVVALVFSPALLLALDPIAQAAGQDTEVLVLAAAADAQAASIWFDGLARDWPSAGLLISPVNTSWIRDFGPLQVDDGSGRSIWLDPLYFGDRPLDDEIPELLAKTFHVALETLDVAIEGGGLISNGNGACAMSFASLMDTGLLDQPHDALDHFLGAIGCETLAVVSTPEDEPTGHIDMFAQFVGPNVAIVADVDRGRRPIEANQLDLVAAGLTEAAAQLGQRLRVVRVPMPISEDGAYRSYINGLRLARSFLTPSYADVPPSEQRAAYDALGAAMPRVRLVAVPADVLAENDGVVHCASLGLHLTTPTKRRRPPTLTARRRPTTRASPSRAGRRSSG